MNESEFFNPYKTTTQPISRIIQIPTNRHSNRLLSMISSPENPFHSAYDIPVIPGRFVFLNIFNIFVERKRIRTMGRTILTPLRLLLTVVLTVLAGDAAAAIRCGLRHVERFAQSAEPVAHTQVWDITADGGDGCRIFFSTNDGLCVYDGIRWNNYRPEGNSVLRALRYDAETGRLYTAGVNEFGYWVRDDYGRLAYTTLYKNPDFRSRSNDFWRIALETHSGRVYFQCREKICIYDLLSGAIRELHPQDAFRYMYEVDGRIYFQDGATLCRLGDDLSRGIVCNVPSRIINLVSGRNGELLAAVEHAGMFSIDNEGRIAPLDTATNALLADAKIMCCRRYNAELLLVGTTRRGLFLIDNDGSASHSIPYGRELDNATILSAAADERGNIWLGLDSGAAAIDNSTQDYYFTDSRLGQVHGVLGLGDDRMLIGSNKGLFLLDNDGSLNLIPGSTGSVWELDEIGGRIYVLHDLGLFRLAEGLRLTPVVTGSGVYSLRRCRNDRRFYIMSTYSGVSLLRHTDEGLQPVSRIADYSGFTRNIRIDEKDRIWVTVLGVGFVRLTLSEDKCSVVEARNYDLAAGTDGNVFSTRIDQELILCCDDRAYRIDYVTDSLVRAPGAEQILGLCGRGGVKSIVQQDNRFWYVAADETGYVERTGNSLNRCAGILAQATRERISSGFRTVGDAGVIGFRNGIGFSYGGSSPSQPVEIGMVAAQGPNKTRYHRLDDPVFEIPAAMNTLRIWPIRLPPGQQLEYRIASLAPEWQTVHIDEFLQIPALPHGRHTVELRAPGAADPSDTRQVEVWVRPPWYISWPMILLYVLVVTLLLAGVRGYYIRKNRLAQEAVLRREKERREKELEQLERENLLKEKRISELEREKLKTDLRNKDKRLANITMNSIRRNNMLNELKSEVSELLTVEGSGRIKTIVGRVIRQINAQLKDDSDWQLSENYFNTIYDGLLDRLRANYPSLSQTDLRLCVYIKLNLSTKETAELMNISPRSVEMARYRLRKKLGLGSNDNIGSVLR